MCRDFSLLRNSISFLPNYPKYIHNVLVSSKTNPTGPLPPGCCHHKPSGTTSGAAAPWLVLREAAVQNSQIWVRIPTLVFIDYGTSACSSGARSQRSLQRRTGRGRGGAVKRKARSRCGNTAGSLLLLTQEKNKNKNNNRTMLPVYWSYFFPLRFSSVNRLREVESVHNDRAETETEKRGLDIHVRSHVVLGNH